MLGLSLDGILGSFKRIGGKRYYFWETTSQGYAIGNLPREMGNISYWKIEIN
jgi:hypothetical protein